MKFVLYLYAVLCAFHTQQSMAEVGAPVGIVKFTFDSTSDTPFSVPLYRSSVYSGNVSSISGNEVSIATTEFSNNQFHYVDGVQDEQYYVLFTSGSLEGRKFDITTNSANSVTLDVEVVAAGQPAPTIEALGSMIGDTFEIRPHWTLNTLFPEGENFPKSTSTSNPEGLILTRPKSIIGVNNGASGINVAPDKSYFYFNHATNNSLDGWYLQGATNLGKMNDVVIDSNAVCVYRNKTNTQYASKVTGHVPTVKVVVNMRVNTVAQDNYLGTGIPIAITLANSGLVDSGFAKSTTPSSPNGDLLFSYAGSVAGYNPSASVAYFYFEHPTNTTLNGWYIFGNTSAGKQDHVNVLKPGSAYVIRRPAGGTDHNTNWEIPLPYDPKEK